MCKGKDTEWKWLNRAQGDRDTCTSRNWSYRWRASYHWWAESSDDETEEKRNRRVSTF